MIAEHECPYCGNKLYLKKKDIRKLEGKDMQIIKKRIFMLKKVAEGRSEEVKEMLEMPKIYGKIKCIICKNLSLITKVN